MGEEQGKKDSFDESVCPGKMFCLDCRKSVGTVVSYEAEAVSFWRKMCCAKTGEDGRATVVHRCRYCKGVLAKFPNVKYQI